MIVKIKITPKKGILDPQGKTIHRTLASLGFENIEDIRIGKYIELKLKEEDKDRANKDVEKMCKKLLSNPVIEDFAISLE